MNAFSDLNPNRREAAFAITSAISSVSSSRASEVNSIAKSKSQKFISVQDWGIFPGAAYAVTNCTQYASLVVEIRAIGQNITILWPTSNERYEFSPRHNQAFNTSSAYAWRNAIELVDVSYVYHLATGVEIHLDSDSTWYRGNPIPKKSGLDEGIIQFRASKEGSCHHVGIIGPCRLTTNDTIDDNTSAHADGSAMGVAYRGCQYTLTDNVTAEYWGTDGIYLGMSYSSAFIGKHHILVNPQTDHCHRQGISVVGNSHGRIIGGYLKNTTGGSFGHGIDFESDPGTFQEDWIVFGLQTKDNQRGACNFINSKNIKFIDFKFDEQRHGVNGTIYIEGSNLAGFDLEDIVFINGIAKGLGAVIYGNIYSGKGGAVDNIKFENCILSTLGDSPAGGSWLRINPFKQIANRIGLVSFHNCSIYGNGGITMIGDGKNTANLVFSGNTKWHLTNPSGANLMLNWNTTGTYVDFSNIEMTVDPEKSMSTQTPYITIGKMHSCKLSANRNAIINWVDYGGGRSNFVIGSNLFTTYSYYKGVVPALDVKDQGTIESPFSFDRKIDSRMVHGGRLRVIAYSANSRLFIDRQLPRDGDLTTDLVFGHSSTSPLIYIFDGHLNQWQLKAV